jgi:hypothetical protein
LALAANVKDKTNRLAILKILKLLIATFKHSIPPNGVCCFVGIDKDNTQLVEIIEPLVSVSQFIYNCGSKFDVGAVNLAFTTPFADSFLILVTGDETKIYSYSAKKFNLLTTVIGLLIKRQRKGGQSSLRFSRLAEESRNVYATRVVEKINASVVDDAVILGSVEMKSLITNHGQLLKNLRTIDGMNTIDSNFINTNRKDLIALLETSETLRAVNDKKIIRVLDLICTNPDALSFGHDIDIDECEYIITTDDELIGDKYILVEKSCQHFKRVKDFESIGKRYFTWRH